MGLSEVFKKVSDIHNVELASEKVELSTESDLIGYAKKITQANKDILDMNKNIASLKDEYSQLSKLVDSKIATIARLQKTVNDAYANNKKNYAGVGKFALGLKSKVEAASKDLGINPDSSANYKALVDAMNNNMWMSIMNIDNSSYFMRDLDSAHSSLVSSIAKIK